jgi:hypothetical protein
MNEACLRLSWKAIAVLTAALASACRSDGAVDRGGDPRGGAAPADVPVFPLKIAESARYFVDQRGTPFLVNGDTPWSLTHNLSYDEAVRYLENRRAKGINALIVSVPDAYGRNGSAGDPPDRQGHRPFLGNDVTQANEPYWQHVDRVLAKTEQALGGRSI